jgi:hypothetical protein
VRQQASATLTFCTPSAAVHHLQATDAAAAAYCPTCKELCEAAGISDADLLLLLLLLLRRRRFTSVGYRRSSSCILPEPQGAV